MLFHGIHWQVVRRDHLNVFHGVTSVRQEDREQDHQNQQRAGKQRQLIDPHLHGVI
jgi:hypothetical protein